MNLPQSVGRYRILGPLGQGAMGVVLRAHDPQLEREVAIKLISVALAAGHGDPRETATRFAREARVAARVHHPNVVSVFDAGEVGDQLFLVMELVDGETLGQKLARGDFPGNKEALEIVAQAADALAAAHQVGVIHRDVKPGNLLITRRGQVKVGDFGVARAIGESTELTRTGMMVGSPAYMAPEQVQGRQLDGRCDLFSLGVVLYEMLLRRKPFPADTLTTLVYQILHEDPFESETVSQQLRPELAEFLKWTLAKEPAHRIPDAMSFASRARILAGGLSGSMTAPTTLMPAPGASPPAPPARADAPPPSYATSAPTAIVERRGSRPIWPFVVGGLFLAGLAVALLLRRPAPPPDTSRGGDSGPAATAQPLVVETPATVAAVPPPKPEPVEPKPVETAPAPLAPVSAPKPAPQPVAPTPIVEPSAQNAAVAAPIVEAAPAPAPVVEAPPIAATYECRRGAEFHVDPEEVIVTIDGRTIGTADEWDGAGGGKAWIFSGPGDYNVKLTLDGHRTEWVRVRVTPSARRDIVDVDLELEEIE